MQQPKQNEQSMMVSLDGGQTYQEAKEGVRVIYSNVPTFFEQEGEGDVHINLTHEGVITDLWVAGSGPASESSIGSTALTLDDIVCSLTEKGANEADVISTNQPDTQT